MVVRVLDDVEVQFLKTRIIAAMKYQQGVFAVLRLGGIVIHGQAGTVVIRSFHAFVLNAQGSKAIVETR